MELDLDDVGDQDEHQDDNWDDEHEPSGDKCESDLRTLAFEQQISFPHCTTSFYEERNVAQTQSTDRCYKLHPYFKRQRGK